MCPNHKIGRCPTSEGKIFNPSYNFRRDQKISPNLVGCPIWQFLLYFLSKKFGSSILRFSQIVDLLFLALFIGDWATGGISFLLKTQEPDPPLFSASALYVFISFAWRALLLTLIVH